ncbi:MAG: zinc-binding dehydrogenase [Anaerolineae bacterium]|nr:zinc-binding dehydrogenase [Anaerolineae bacterium]
MIGMMKKVVITAPQQAELVEMPIPQPKANWALVRMTVVPMCTEYKAWLQGPGDRERILALGHEGVGEVVEVAQPCGVEVGDRVVVMQVSSGPCGRCVYCRAGDFLHCQNQIGYTEFTGEPEPTGAYAQYRLGAAWLLPTIPDDIPDDHAVMAWCGLGPTFGAMQTARVDAFDTVLITGAGPVGQGAIINAKFRGAEVIVAELEPWRMERAKMLGAGAVVDPRDPDVLAWVRSLTQDDLGVTCAIDCAGVTASQRLCIDATRPKGRVCFVAESNDPLPITVSPDMIRKGLTLIGQWHYSVNDFDQIMQVIRASGDLLDIQISHRFPMSRVQDALALSASHRSGKILLDPWA